jgi:predicted GTPase
VKTVISRYNSRAIVVDATSPLQVSNAQRIAGKRVLVVEDGPTLTHGGMTYGAGLIAAQRFGAAEIVDPRPYARGSLAATFATHPALCQVLPAMGYGAAQMAELEATINAVPCDLVIFGTPVDLRRVLNLRHPGVRVRYDVKEIGYPTLADALPSRLDKRQPSA